MDPSPDALPAPPEPLPPPGWLHDPSGSGKQRYWDGAAWSDQTRHANSFKRRFHFSPYWLLGIVAGLLVLWGTGVFDEQLVDIGLNAQDWFDPVDGEVVCGSEAQELIEAQENPPVIPEPYIPPEPGGIPTVP